MARQRVAGLDAEARAKLASLGYISGPASGAGHERRLKDPKDMIALYQAFDRAHWDLVAGNLAKARGELERLVAADPDDPVFVGQLAEVCRAAGDREKAIEAGADDYDTKPVELPRLLDKISALLARKAAE